MWQKDGFANPRDSVVDSLKQLQEFLEKIPACFSKLDDEARLVPLGPGKWSRQQILGHLVDSALNNLQRLTEAAFLPQPYQIRPYRQEDLVLVNGYQELPPGYLVDLWTALNRQLLWVVRRQLPDLQGIAVANPYEAGGLRDLAWVFCDYVAHLEHHWKQLHFSC
jgi:hypothetical protein